MTDAELFLTHIKERNLSLFGKFRGSVRFQKKNNEVELIIHAPSGEISINDYKALQDLWDSFVKERSSLVPAPLKITGSTLLGWYNTITDIFLEGTRPSR